MSYNDQEFEDLSSEIMVLKELNQKFAQRLELKENEIREMSELIGELTSQSNEKSNAIGKATKVIESLRDELEKAKNDIKFLELDKQKLIQENRFNEKELLEIQKENLNYENLKKSETRAKNKTQKLKDEITTISQEFSQREQELLEKIEELEGERYKMELRLEENDKLVLALEERFTLKDQEYLVAMQRVSALEEENQRLFDEIQDMKREKENTENYYEKELRMIKKEAENSIRYYKNLGKPFTLTVDTKNKENEFDAFDSQINYQDQNILMHSNEPSAILEPKTLNRVPSQFFETQKEENVIPQRHSVTRTASKLNTGLKRKPESAKLKRDPSRKALGEKIGFDNIQTTDAFESNEKGKIVPKTSENFLKAALAESIERENNLVQYIEKNINKEAEIVNKISETVLNKEVTLRPEIERWMMRNEELEQRLFEYAQKMRVLEIFVRDCRKAVEINQAQRINEKKLHEQLVRELESIINFLHIEVEEKNKFILKLFPEYQILLNENVTVSQDKLNSLFSEYKVVDDDLLRVKNEQKELLYHFDDLKKEHRDLLHEYAQLRDNLIDVGKLLGIDSGETNDVHDNQTYNLPPQYEAIVERIEELQNSQREFRIFRNDTAEEKAKLKTEINNLEKEVRDLVNEKNISQKEKIEIQDEITRLDDAIKDLNSKLEDSRRRLFNTEKDKQELNELLSEKNSEIEALKNDLHEKELHIQQLNSQLSSSEEELQHKAKKIDSLMSQIDEAVAEKQVILNKLTATNTDCQQTFDLLEKALKDFETAQEDLEKCHQALQNKEDELEFLRIQVADFEIRFEEDESLLRQKDQELTAANITIEHKNSIVSMLEEKLKEVRKSEETVRSELTKTQMDLFETSSLLATQKQIASFKERPSKDLESASEKDLKKTKPNIPTIEKEKVNQTTQTQTEEMGRSQTNESIEEKYRSMGASNNQYYQRKIQEYELFLDYIQINLKDIAEGKHKTQSIHAVFEEKMQHIVSQNTILADLYINMKHTINTITSKFKDAADLETKFLVELIQIILDKLSLSLEDRSLLEGKYFSILNSPLKEKKVSNQATLELKDILLKILQKKNSWERRNVIQSPSPIKRQTTRTYPTEISLTLNVSKLSDNLAALSTNIVEKATMVKPILEKLNRFKNYLSRSNYDSRDRREGNARSLLQGVITSLDELLTRNQRIMTSEARIIYEISLKLKEGIQNPNNEEVNLTEKVTNTFLESKELLSKCFEELNNIDKEYVEIKRSNTESDQGTGNSTLKTLTETKRELKNHTFDLLKEFYSEISDVISIFYKYCSKIESKSKSKRLSTLTEEPMSILKALEENLTKNTQDYIDTLKKEFSEYLNGEEEVSKENLEFLQKIFNFRIKLFNIDKLEEETNNFKNVFKLLDISCLLKDADKDESQYLLNYEQIRTRSHEVNKTIEKIIELLPSVVLKSRDIVSFDIKSLNTIEEPQILYDKLRNTYSDPDEDVKRNSGSKTHVRYEIAELLKENGGCRIAMNYLLYVFYKFKIIISDLSKEES